MDTPHLISIGEAIARYPVSRRTLRRHIAAGHLPAAKPGRELLIDEKDLARLLAPTVREAPPAHKRETTAARERRQLRAAGVQI